MLEKIDRAIVSDLRKKINEYNEVKLLDEELLCMVIRTGDELKDVMTLSRNLIRRYGSLSKLSEIPIITLVNENKGLTMSKAAELKAAFEIGRRASQSIKCGMYISCAEDVISAAGYNMVNLKQEHFRAVLLNTKNRLIGIEEISIGTINASLVHAREVFRNAITKNAYSIILLHNHPSGDPNPSENDLRITENLVETGKIIGIKIADHIIVGGDEYYSFLGAGRI